MKREKEIIESYYENLWNKQDKTYIDKLFDDNIIFRGFLGIETKGKQEFENYFDLIISALPNLYHGVEVMIAEDNHVAARAVYNGRHKGKLFDFEPTTNNMIKYNGVSFFTIKNDKIVEIWVLSDLNALFQFKPTKTLN